MFLLYVMKGVASGELEAIRARKAMTSLRSVLEQQFQVAGMANAVSFQYSTNILRISFSDEVLFEPGQYTLHARGHKALEVCARALGSPQAPHFAQIQVEGHTDSNPLSGKAYPHDNWELSSARAVAVLKELRNMGVRPDVISANGYADQVTIDDGHSIKAHKRNRRIELRIVYSIPRPSKAG
jgi:chemotaxis protein MotB